MPGDTLRGRLRKRPVFSRLRSRFRFAHIVDRVLAKHVRWTEALRVVRAYHPEVTIILPEEKMQLLPGDDVRAAIAPMVGVIRRALDAGVGQWHGYTETCRVRQVRLLLSHYFHYHEGCIGAEELDLLIEDLLYVHKA